MKHEDLQELMELARQRPLSADELARVEQFTEAHPQARIGWDEDMALTRLLGGLSDAPLASNFTSRVMQAVALEEPRGERASNPMSLQWWTRNTYVRLGLMACCVALVAVGGWYRHQLSQRADLAESVATISEVAAISSVEVLKDFETIQSFGKVPPVADMEADLHLLAALE